MPPTHRELSLSKIDNLPSRVLVPLDPADPPGVLSVNLNLHGGGSGGGHARFLRDSWRLISDQPIREAACFAYGTRGFGPIASDAGGVKWDRYTSALASAIASDTGRAMRLNLSCHSFGGRTLTESLLRRPTLVDRFARQRTAFRLLDPVIFSGHEAGLRTLVERGCPVGIVWGRLSSRNQGRAVRAFVAWLRANLGAEISPSGDGDHDVQIPSRGVFVLQMSPHTPWNSHGDAKKALPFLMDKTTLSTPPLVG